jgi:hypothetical protein
VSAFEGLFETDAQDDAADTASNSNDGHSIPWDGEDFYDPNSFDMYDSPEPNPSPTHQQDAVQVFPFLHFPLFFKVRIM